MATLVFTVHNVTADRDSGFPSTHRSNLARVLRTVAEEKLGVKERPTVSFVGDASSGERGEKAEGPVVIIVDVLGDDKGEWGGFVPTEAARLFGTAATETQHGRQCTVSVRRNPPTDESTWTATPAEPHLAGSASA